MRLTIRNEYGVTHISLYQDSYSTSTASVPLVPVAQKVFNSDDFALMAKVLERDFDVADGWAELLRQMPHKRERIEQAFATACTNRLLGGK